MSEGRDLLDQAQDSFSRGDVDAGVAHLSGAIRSLTAEGDKCAAAMASAQLGDVFANMLGNLTAGRAWWTRARRMLEDEPACVEQGWVAVAALGCHVDDPDELLGAADLALDRARRFGDVELEAKALADAGLAHVQAGRLGEGMKVLDEAMGLACGLDPNADSVGKSVCSFFTACYFAADYTRAGTWADLLRRRRIIGPTPGSPVFLSAHCDSVQAALLVELGRWTEAETLLEQAATSFTEAMGFSSAHPEIELALLRVRQGRLADAEALLLGKEQSIQALLPSARLHLERGDLDLARATARRGLKVLRGDRLRAVELLTVLVEVELQSGHRDRAAELAEELAGMADAVDVASLRARAAGARARVLGASGEPGTAVQILEEAVDSLPADLPWLRAGLLTDLARMREAAGDGPGAQVDAKAAVAVLSGLDVVVSRRDRELLDRLTGAGTPKAGAVLAVEDSNYLASADGRSTHLRPTKGLAYLAALLADPGREIHVFDLMAVVEGGPADDEPDRHQLGDAGEVLDRRARDEFRRRVEALRSGIDDALEADMLDTAEALQAELDLVVAALSEAFGLGGRSRKAASAVEKARLNVTRAIRAATAKITDGLPAAGGALDASVRTGVYCAYEPTPGAVRWDVQSGLNGTAPD